MTAINFPDNPTIGQIFVATNAVTYIWLGDRWNTTVPIQNNTAVFYYEGGGSTTWEDTTTPDTDIILDGGYSDLNYPFKVEILDIENSQFGEITIVFKIQGFDPQIPIVADSVGVVIGPGSVSIDDANDICSGGPNPSQAIYVPFRGFSNDYDCNQSIVTNNTDGSFTISNIPVYQFSGETVNVVGYAVKAGQPKEIIYSDTVRYQIPYIICFGAGTEITLANGSKKPIESVTYNDSLRVWNFDEGKLDSAKPFWIKKAESTPYFNRSHFADGTHLDTLQYVKGHRVFNKTQNKFTFIYECKPGDEIVKDNNITKFTGWEIVKEKITYYNIITDFHMNLYANDILTSTGFNNLYPFKDMRFVKEQRTHRTYNNIPDNWVKALRLAENITEDVNGMTRHLANLEKLRAIL